MTVGVGGALGFLHPLRSTLVFDGADHQAKRFQRVRINWGIAPDEE